MKCLRATDGEVPPKSLCLKPVPKFLSEMYTWFHFFHFRAFWKPCLREISYVSNVANLEKVIMCISVEKLL